MSPHLDDSTQTYRRSGLIGQHVAQDDVEEAGAAIEGTAPYQRRLFLGSLAVLSLLGSHSTTQPREYNTVWRTMYVRSANELANSAPQTTTVGAINAVTTITDKVVGELGRLRTGWAGEGSLAPSDSVISDVESVLDLVPAFVPMPSVDVDHEDGTVAVRWVRADKTKSFSCVFRGDRRVTLVSATVDPPKSRSWGLPIEDESAVAAVFEDAKFSETIGI